MLTVIQDAKEDGRNIMHIKYKTMMLVNLLFCS